jgi:Protein of unknown function (DUF3829)
MIRTRIFAAAIALGLQSAVALAQQPAPAPTLGLTSISDAELDRYIAKSNGVVGLLNSSLRGEESWNRYLSWVDAKRGPTGKERIIYGLYSVGSSAKDAIEKARQSAAADPAIPALDGATKDLASAFEKLVPILNEAEAYYDRKDYMSDNMAGGKALHEKLVPAAMTFLAARERTNELQDQFKDLIDRQQLAKIEKAEGKSVRWHVRNTMMLAKKAVDLMPDSPKRGTDLKQFDAALATYGEAVRDFDNAIRDSGKSTSIDSYPRDILGRLREMRDNIAKGRANGMTFQMDHQGIITSYNMMVSMSNAFR